MLKADVRPGGAWRAEVRNPDGSGAWSHGVYREIVAPKRIVYTFARDATDTAETVVTVTLDDGGGKTSLTAHQGPFTTPEDSDGVERGLRRTRRLPRHCQRRRVGSPTDLTSGRAESRPAQ
ncbi:MAG: SRPBCC domain-containing protein [Chloroflexota bacterium]|nr:SRPBCC domain-containing protein [Chloroflexota bacterium]